MMSGTPARVMGVGNRKGELVAGKDADIVFFDDTFTVKLTLIEGRVVFRQEEVSSFYNELTISK